MTFLECSEKYLERKKRRKKIKHKTVLFYKNHFIRITQYFGERPIESWTTEDIDLFLDFLEEDHCQTPASAVSANLPSYIYRQKHTRASVAQAAKLSVTTVENAAKGKSVSIKSADKIAAVLGMPTEELFVITDRGNPLSDKSISEHFHTVNMILKYAVKMGFLERNPCDRAEPPAHEEVEVNYFQPETARKILAALKQEDLKWQAYVQLLAVGGMRRGEVAGLQWENVFLDEGVIKIRDCLLYSPEKGLYIDSPKNKKTRWINIPQQTIELLREYKKWYSENKEKHAAVWQAVWEQKRETEMEKLHGKDFLFCNTQTGWPMYPDTLNAWLIRFSERHDLPHLNPHAFRHTLASILIFEGADILSIAHRLGHSKPSTTENIYGQIIDMADAMNSKCIANVLFQ